MGPDGSPYEKGVFHLEIEIPERFVPCQSTAIALG
jgi:ubiquitin-protein ligase